MSAKTAKNAAAKSAAAKSSSAATGDRRHASSPRFFPLREYLEALLIAGIFLGFSNTFIVKTFYIPSESMVDTLLVGDHLFVNRLVYGQSGGLDALMPTRELRRGDVVIFRSPESPTTDLVKRCVGLPGDSIEMVDKQLLINGSELPDDGYAQNLDERVFANKPYFSRQTRLRDNFGPFVVPEGEYFFLGDNRDFSYDSRYWGSVPRRYIKGRALLIYWSYGGKTPDGTESTWGEGLTQLGETALGFFSKTRWDRSFHLVR